MSTLNTTNLKNESSVTNNIVLGADGSVDFNGTVTATSFVGDGSGLTSLDAGDISAGTLAIARGGTNSTATPTQGGAAYGTGSAFAFTSAGSSGQVLTSNGTSAPTWQDAGGGAWNFISSVTANNSASLAFTGLDSTYDVYVITISDFRGGDDLCVRLSTNNGSSYNSGTNEYRSWYQTNTVAAVSSSPDTKMRIAYNGYSSYAAGGFMYLYSFADSSSFSNILSFISAPAFGFQAGGARVNDGSVIGTSATNAIQLFTRSGTISTGTFRLYGISNS